MLNHLKQKTPFQFWTVAMLFGAVFLMSHPFTGVRHDGTLYAGEALARLLPSEFRDDLYFYFGSQGRFTILPALYAGLIETFGLGQGTIIGMLIAFCLFIASTAYLVYALVPSRWREMCVLSVLLGWSMYGGNRIFAFSEPFLTARSIAEPAVLFGFGLLVRRHWLGATVALLIAAAVHPLVAATGILVAWLWLATGDRRWAWLGIVSLAALGALGKLKVGSFGDLFSRYDPQWLDLVHEDNGHVFIRNWFLADYGVIAFNFTVLWFALRCVLAREASRLIVAICAVAAGSLLVSYVLVDLVGNPFFGKLQIWRTTWLLQWLAMAMLPVSAMALWERDEHGKMAAIFLVIGWMAMFTLTPGLLALMSILVETSRGRIVVTQTTTRICGALAVIAALAISLQHEFRVFKFGALLDQGLAQVLGQALSMNILLFVGAALFSLRRPRLGRLGPLVALVACVVAASVWDQRGPWTHKLESYAPGEHIWPGLIDASAKVYWYRELIAPWVLLGHGNYYTQQQGSGAVFSRDMSVELEKRRKVTALLDFQEQVCRMMNNLSEKQGSCEPDAAAVRSVCNDGGIDYVVLQSTLEGAAPIADFSTGVVENGYEKKFFLYRCSALKSG